MCRHILHHQVTGRLDPWAFSRAHAIASQSYLEASFIDAHPWRTPLLGASHCFPPSGCIQCAQFDSTGELLVTGSEDGSILVHSGEALQQAAWAAHTFSNSKNKTLRSGGGNSLGTNSAATPGATSNIRAGNDNLPQIGPMLALRSGLPSVDYIQWNPTNENVIAAASRLTKSVNIYDLQQTQGRPKQTRHLPGNIAGNAGDLAFCSGGSSKGAGPQSGTGGYSLVVGGPSGQVFVWDLRMAGPPATTLHSTRGGTVTSVALIENNHAVIAGTQGGDIKAWDLRGGSGGALRFGGVIHHHPLLTCIDLCSALAQIPGLSEQAGNVPSCSIHSMVLSPVAPYRAGFHLGCGWSGVVDLRTKKVTHVHAPSQALVDEQPTAADGARAMVMWTQMAAPTLRRKACWSADGRKFVVPSRHRESLLLLDFEESSHAGCYALGGSEEEEQDINDTNPSAVGVVGEESMVTMAGSLVENTTDADMLLEEDRIRARESNHSRYRDSDSDDHDEDVDFGRYRWRRNPSAVEVSISQPSICAAAMPGDGSRHGEVIVAAGAHNQLSLVRPR